MSTEVHSKKAQGKAKLFTLEQAQESILAKLREAGPKGVGAFWTAKTVAPKRETLERALESLQASGVLVIDTRRTKPKYFLDEHAPEMPCLETVCARLAEAAKRAHPQVLAESELKKTLQRDERNFLEPALALLLERRQLVGLKHKTTQVFAHGETLQTWLTALVPLPDATLDESAAAKVRTAYRELVRSGGFPSVEIAALGEATALPLPALRDWLLGEYRQGRAVLSQGDWSLADEKTRTGAVELRGERYLLAQLLD